MQSFIQEVQRRKVFNTFLPYLGFVWLMLQVVSLLVPILNLSPLINTLTVVVLFAGIPVMLYISWYFNFSMNGIEAIPDAKSGEVSKFGLAKWLIFIVITLLSGYVGVSYFYSVKVEYSKANEGTTQQLLASSIAVFSFVDATPEQDQGYIARGIAKQVSELIGSANRLRVLDIRSAQRLLARGDDPVRVARNLVADALLTGTVRRTGNTLRIGVELVNVTNGKVLWAEAYTRDVEQVQLMEATIARAVLNSLMSDFIAAEDFTRLNVASPQAYQIYLMGQAAYSEKSIESLKQARKYFDQAIKLSPDFSQAYVGMAETVLLMSDRSQNFELLDQNIAKTLAQNYLEKALVQTQTLPSAFLAQGKVFALNDKLDEALAAFNKAISLNNSLADAYYEKHIVLEKLNRNVEAAETLEQALSLHPELIMCC